MLESGENIKAVRNYLKFKIKNDTSCLKWYEKEETDVYDLLKRTVDSGESNSALLIGPKGVGKSTLVKTVLSVLRKSKHFISNSITVQLNGFCHTDDRIALKSITNQMKLDNAVDGKVFGSFAENLSFLIACLKAGQKDSSKSVIFILEEFDLFCSHQNQTLLYNLLDIAQSAQTPICVLGVTCRLDVVELFEKRVKSRFSHRQFFLFPHSEVNLYIERLKNILSISKDCKKISDFNRILWNKHVEQLVADDNFRIILQRQLDIGCDEYILKNMLFQVTSQLNCLTPHLTVQIFEDYCKKFKWDDCALLLQDLSVLELCLLIAIRHHIDIYDNQPFNFEMILTRYTKFVAANSHIQSVSRLVIFKAFEHLQNMDLIGPISNRNTNQLQKEYQMFDLLIDTTQILNCIQKISDLPTEVIQWASSSLV